MTRLRSNKKQLLGIGLVAAVIAIMVSIGLQLGPASGQETDTSEPGTAVEVPLDTVPVERGDLSETKEAVGSVSYGDSWAAPIEPTGVVTKRHETGTVVEPGDSLIWVGNRPVLLAKGETPVYRTMELVAGRASKQLKGEDVKQLQEFLLSKGFDDKGRLTADGQFGVGTKRAVMAWQVDIGREKTGSVDRSQIAFHPSALRIESAQWIGANFESLSVTEGTQRITADFDNKSRPFLPVGATVELEDGEGNGRTGTITKVAPTIGDDGSQRLRATITPDQPLSSGLERLNVTASRDVATDALIVPVRAIVALAGGGYAVEVDGPSGQTLTRVELGSVVDDLVEITGELTESDRIVVPVDLLGEDS